MSSIIFGYTMSLTTAATPSTGFLVAYDEDGILKQKDSAGVITAISGSSSGVGSLSQVLSVSNDSGAYSILMGTGTSVSSQNGLSSLYLDYNSVTSSVYLTNGYNYLSLTNTTMSLVSGLSSTINISNGTNYLKLTSTYSEVFSTTEVRLRVFNTSDEILLKSNIGTSVTSTNLTSNAVFIGSQNSSFASNITNSVIIGGLGQSAILSNSVYIPDTYIQDGKSLRGSAGNSSLRFTDANNLILQNNNTLLALISSTSSTTLTTNGIIISDTNSAVTSPSIDSYATFISAKNGYIESGVQNAIIIGGDNLINSMTNSVVLGEYVNINNKYTLPVVDGLSGEVMVTDGSGNITWQTSLSSTQNLSSVLSVGNDSGIYSIQMGTATSIYTSRGGGQIDLDYTTDSVAISTDNGFLNKAHIQLDNEDLIIEATANLNIGANTASVVISNGEGLVYGFDYSSTFVTYSLVDKNYVDLGTSSIWSSINSMTSEYISEITAGSGLTGGGTSGTVNLDVNIGNGLEIVSDTIYLGGTLSQNTTINTSTYDFSINSDLFFIDSSSNNIGIGTNTPTQKLEVYGTSSTMIKANSTLYSYLSLDAPSSSVTLANEGSSFRHLMVQGGSEFFFGNGPNSSSVYTKYNTSTGNWLFSSRNLGGSSNVSTRTTDAKVTIVGEDDTSSNSALEVYNVATSSSVESLLFKISNSGSVSIGTSSIVNKLNLVGDSSFITETLTTSTTPSFVFLDGVTTPTDTSTIKSFYKEFRPTTTSSATVVGDGTILYPDITTSSSGEFYAKANLILYTGDLSLLTSIQSLTSEVNVVQIQTNTGTYSSTVKSSSSVFRNITSGATVDSYVGFWANGFDAYLTHNGTTNAIYGFYMDDQTSRSGNIPLESSRYGVYIKDPGLNFFAGSVGIGTAFPNYALEVSGTVSTTGFMMTDGASAGYVLTSDASGNAYWTSSISSSNFANTDLTLTGNRIHDTNGNDLIISSDGNTLNDFIIGFQGTSSLSIGHTNYYQEFTNYEISIQEFGGTRRLEINSTETIFGPSNESRDFRIVGLSDSSVFFMDASNDSVGVGTDTPQYKLEVLGTVSTTGFRMPTSPTAGYVLTSDSFGNGTWQAASGGGTTPSLSQVLAVGNSSGTNNIILPDPAYIGFTSSSYTMRLFTTTLTANWSIVMPNKGGTMALVSDIPTSLITGSGSTNYIPKWSSSTGLTNSLIYDNGSTICIGETTSSTDTLLYLKESSSSIKTGLYTEISSSTSYNVGISSNVGSSLGFGSGDFAIVGNIGASTASNSYSLYGRNVGSSTNKYGGYNTVTGNGSSTNNYGSYNLVSGANTFNYGVYNIISGTYGNKYGMYTIISGQGSNYGQYTSLSSTGSVNYGLYISSAGATNNYGVFVNSGTNIFNHSGDDYDFQIKGATEDYLFYLDASTDRLGIGTVSPTDRLHVIGTVSTTGFKMPTGASAGYVLTSDASGNAYWDQISPYKVYVALLSQTGTSAPTSVELENTFGITATFSYISPGYYELWMTGQLTSGKTFIINGSPDQSPIGGNFGIFITEYNNNNIIRLSVVDDGGTFYDGGLNNTSIEIRVYP